MNLLSKTNRYYLLFSALLLTLGGGLFYMIISSIIREDVGEILEMELSDFMAKAKEDAEWLDFEKPIEFEIVPTDLPVRKDIFSDTTIRDGHEHGPYLQLKAFRSIQGKNYLITLRESMLESEDILFAISITMVSIFALLLVGLILLNNYLTRHLWKPFYANLAEIKAYDVSQLEPVRTIDSDISEFQELNMALMKMTDRTRKDYLSLKEFTENASHELQTPLAIIRSSTDALVQRIADDSQLNDLAKIEMATNRIAKTNKALLLLTKIENRYYTDKEEIEIKAMVTQTVEDLSDLMVIKQIRYEFKVVGEMEAFHSNRSLVQILLSNLVSNAIRHNVKGGQVTITLDGRTLAIENTGKPLKLRPSQLFDRFVKENQSSESTGLGLAIVKTICRALGLEVEYGYSKEVHRVRVIF